MSSAPSTQLSIKEQAEFLEAFIRRFHPEPGADCGRVLCSMEADVADELRALAARLKRMAPHEAEIRRVVTGR